MVRALVGGLPEFNGINYGEKDEKLEDVNISNILRLFNLGGISDKELGEKISELLGRDLNKPKTLSYVNDLYQKAISTYEKAFLIDVIAPFSGQKFKNKNDILTFLRYTFSSRNKERRQVYCDLVKVMFCYHEVEKHPQMVNAEEDIKEFVSGYYLDNEAFGVGKFKLDLAGIMGKKEDEDYFETTGKYFKKMPGGNFKSINCTLRYRGKSVEKMVIKMLGSENGNANVMEIINDSMGIELESDNKKESIYLLEYEYFVHKQTGKLSQTDFRQKLGFYNNEDIKYFLSLDELSHEFKEYIKEELKSLKKLHGTMKYQDCKFQGMVTLPSGSTNGLESRVVVRGNKNQSGLSSSRIIDGKKIINAMIGLRGWVSGSYIKRIVDKISMDPKVKKDATTIFNDFTGKLIKLSVPKLNRNIYSSALRLEEVIKNASEYPDFMVNAIRNKLYPKSSIPDIVDAVKGGTQNTLS